MIHSEKVSALTEANSTSPASLAPRYIKISTAVTYTAISRSVIYELLNAGKIKSHKVGGARVIDRESLDAFISSQPAN